jgi:hypothetical protein
MLTHIIKINDIKLFELFLAYGADYNDISSYGCCTPVLIAIKENSNFFIF